MVPSGAREPSNGPAPVSSIKRRREGRMTAREVSAARCAVLVGPYTSGKTTLLEAMLHVAGATHRKGSITQGNTVGDASPEARHRQMSTEPNFATCEYLGERWSLVDCPGSIELMHDRNTAVMGADLAIIVAEPEIGRARAGNWPRPDLGAVVQDARRFQDSAHSFRQ